MPISSSRDFGPKPTLTDLKDKLDKIGKHEETSLNELKTKEGYTFALEALNQCVFTNEQAEFKTDSELLTKVCLKVLTDPEHQYESSVAEIIEATYQAPFLSKPDLLHEAIKNKDLTLISFLLQHGASLNQKDQKGFPPLYYATKDPIFLEQLIDKLIELKIPLDLEIDEKGNTLLHHYLSKEYLSQGSNKKTIYQTINKLLQNGANFDHCNKEGYFAYQIGYTPQFLSLETGCRCWATSTCNFYVGGSEDTWKKILTNPKGINYTAFKNPFDQEESPSSYYYSRGPLQSKANFPEFFEAFLTPEIVKANPNLAAILIGYSLIIAPKQAAAIELTKKVLPLLSIENRLLLLSKAIKENDINIAQPLIALIPPESLLQPYPNYHTLLFEQPAASPLLDAYESGNQTVIQALVKHNPEVQGELEQILMSREELREVDYSLIEAFMESSHTHLASQQLFEKLVKQRSHVENSLNVMHRLLSKEEIDLSFLSLETLTFLIETAYDKKFYEVITLFLKQINQQLPQETLEKIAKSDNFPWLTQTLKILHERNLVDLKIALTAAVSNKNDRLALYLLSLGADPRDLSTQDFSHLDEKFRMLSQRTDGEREFLKVLHTKTLNMVFGDAHTHKMRGFGGMKLDGYLSSIMFDFTLKAMKLYQERGEQLPAGLSELIAEGVDTSQLGETKGEYALTKLSSNYLEKIKSMKPGEEFATGYGWSKHALTILCHKLDDGTCAFILFNAGLGSETNHEYLEVNGRSYVNSARAFKIPIADLEEKKLLETIFEPNILDGKYTSHDVYSVFYPYALDASKEKALVRKLSPHGLPDAWILGQIAGNCPWSSLAALLAFKLGPEKYNHFLTFLKEESVDLAVKYLSQDLQENPTFRLILEKGIPNLFSHLKKELENRKPSRHSSLDALRREQDRMQAVQQSFEALRPAQEMHKASLPTSQLFPTETNTLLEKMRQKVVEKPLESPSTPSFEDLHLPDLSQLNDPSKLASIIEAYNKALETLSNLPYTQAQLASQLLRQIGQLYLNGDPTQLEKLQALTQGMPLEEVNKKYIQPLQELSKVLFISNKSFLSNVLENKLALTQCLHLAWQLHPTHTEYSISGQDLQETLQNLPLLAQLDPNLKNEIDTFMRFLSEQKRLQNKSIFDFSRYCSYPRRVFEESKFANQVYLELPENEIALGLQFYEQLPAEEKEKAAAAYKAKLEDRLNGFAIIDERKWKATWGFINSPKDFSSIWNMAIRARQITPLRVVSDVSYLESRWSINVIDDLPTDKARGKEGRVTFAVNQTPTISGTLHPQAYFDLQDHRAINKIKERNSQKSFLPEEKSNLELSRPPDDDQAYQCFDKLYLASIPENSVIRNADISLKPILSSRSELDRNLGSGSALPYTMLMQAYGKDLDLLDEAERIQLIEITLFNNPAYLKKALQEHPFLKQELSNFFKECYATLLNDSLIDSFAPSKLKAAASYLTMHLQFLQIAEEIYGQQVAEEILALREEASKLSKNLKVQQKPEIQQGCYLAIMLSYHTAPPASENDLQLLYQTLASWKVNIEKNKLAKQLPPALIHLAQSQTTHHKEAIETLLQDPAVAHRLAKAFLAAQVSSIELPEDIVILTEHFPMLICQSGSGSWDIDLISGSVLINGKLPTSQYHLQGSQPYKNLYNKKNILFAPSSLGHVGIDPFGRTIRMTMENNAYQLYVELKLGQKSLGFLRYLDSNEIPEYLPKLPNLQIWRDEKSNPNGYAYVDPKSGQAKVYLDSNGHFTFADETSTSFEMVSISSLPEGKDINTFHKDAILWQEVGKSGETAKMRLEFPNYFFPNYSEPLQFERFFDLESKQFVWALKNNKEIRLASNQTVKGFREYPYYLVLENPRGDQQLLVPMLPYNQLSDSFIKVSADTPTHGNGCMAIPMKEGKPTTSEASKNLMLAYMALATASKPEDYREAMQYLKNAERYEPYSDEELQLFGLVFNLHHEARRDRSPQAAAVRLYAAWLVQDNFERNPLAPKGDYIGQRDALLSRTYYNGYWRSFWTGQFSWRKKEGAEEHSVQTEVEELQKKYRTAYNRVDAILRLEDQWVDTRELERWGLMDPDRSLSLGAPTEAPPCTFTPHLSEFNPKRRSANFDINPNKALRMRPGSALESNFASYYEIASGPNTPQKERLIHQLQAMRYESKASNQAFRTILLAVAQPHLYSNSSRIKDLVDRIANPPPGAYDKNQNYQQTKVDDLNREVRQAFKEENSRYPNRPSLNTSPMGPSTMTSKIGRRSPFVRPASIPTLQLPQTLPETPKAKFELKNGLDRQPITRIQGLLKPKTAPKAEAKSFEYKPKVNFPDPSTKKYMASSIKELNEDLKLGVEKNQKTTQFELQPGVTPEKLKANRESIETKRAEESGNVARLETKLLALANKLPSEKLLKTKTELDLASKQKKPFTLDECIALFLQQDAEQLKSKTFLSSEAEVQEFFQTAADYLVASRHVSHLKQISEEISNYEKASNDSEREQVLQKIGLLTEQKRHLDMEKDRAISPVLLVFEYYLEMYLREDSIESLRNLTAKDGKFPNVLLQKIQGGGKTLIFGHILALAKADGYHLSLHVPPTAQYASVIYDMKRMSNRLFGQKERTLEFDDHPSRYTEKHLTYIHETMLKAIVNREYITITNESLRAMRSKYIRESQSLNDDPKPNPEAEARLKQLEDILALIDERAVLTLDEVHVALDSRKELNMPTGKTSTVDKNQIEVIGKIIRYAASATTDGIDKEGNKVKVPLVKLKANLQSQQTDEQRVLMIQQTREALLADEEAMAIFGAKSDSQKREVRNYLEGKGELPFYMKELIETSEKSTPKKLTAADHLILAKQMLSGGWLEDGLSRSVNQHHGFPIDPKATRISIPYIANMTPADRSEFSDQLVMTINTLLAYSVEGVTKEQAEEIVKESLLRAYAEHTGKKNAGFDSSIDKTDAAKDFHQLTGLSLVGINIKDPEVIGRVQTALNQDHDLARKVMFDYVKQRVIPKKEFYSLQVCTHGQNLAGMGKAMIGYSGSFENPNMTPVGATAYPDKGTNGQTIDLLLRQNDDVHIIGNTPEALLDKMQTHPDRALIRAIIDIGCQFRGVPNETVAQKILKALPKDSPVKGVLFFNPAGKLCFLHKDNPDRSQVLSGTSRETLFSETGCRPEELFTYYDQDHCTGVDIQQMPFAKGLLTISEHTKIHEVLQGAKRFRALEFGQKLITTVQEGALNAIGSKLEKEVSHQIGMEDVILYTHIKEVEPQPVENLAFIMQKMEEAVQKRLLRKMRAAAPDKKREVRTVALPKLTRSVEVDLVAEYGMPRTLQAKKDFLRLSKENLLKDIQPFFTETEWKELTDLLDKIISDGEGTIQDTISISSSGNLEKPKDGTNTQFEFKEVKVEQQNDQQRLNDMVGLKQIIKQVDAIMPYKQLAKELPWTPDDLFSPNFGNPVKGTGATPEFKPELWSMNAILNKELNSTSSYFSNDFIVTSNFAALFKNQTDLISAPKELFQALMIEDQNGHAKLILCTVKESYAFEKMLFDPELDKDSLPYKYHLIQLNGKALLSTESPIQTEEDEKSFLTRHPQLCPLMAQAIFYSCQWQHLNQEHLMSAYKTWMNDSAIREQSRQLFEHHLIGKAPTNFYLQEASKVLFGDMEPKDRRKGAYVASAYDDYW